MARTTPARVSSRADHKVLLVATVIDMQCLIEWGSHINGKGQYLGRCFFILKSLDLMITKTWCVWWSASISLHTGGITVEPWYSEPLKRGHTILMDVLLRNGFAFPSTVLYYNPWNADTLLFRKADKFFGPSSTWTVQNSLVMPTLACHSRKVVCHRWPIQQLDINNSTGTYNTNFWLAFLASLQQGRVLGCA